LISLVNHPERIWHDNAQSGSGAQYCQFAGAWRRGTAVFVVMDSRHVIKHKQSTVVVNFGFLAVDVNISILKDAEMVLDV